MPGQVSKIHGKAARAYFLLPRYSVPFSFDGRTQWTGLPGQEKSEEIHRASKTNKALFASFVNSSIYGKPMKTTKKHPNT